MREAIKDIQSSDENTTGGMENPPVVLFIPILVLFSRSIGIIRD